MQVANEVYVMMEKWAAEQRRRSDGGLGYGNSCLASLGEAGGAVFSALLPKGVHDEAGAFLLIDQVMGAVNPLVAAVVTLRYVGRFTLEQVARKCSCSLATVKRRLHDGLVAVQEVYMLGGEPVKLFSVKKAA